MTKRLSDLLGALPADQLIYVSGDTEITAPVVEADAEVQPGGVFVARKGLLVDGHDFIPRAIERGAAAIVGERDLSDLPLPYAQVENAQEAVGYLAATYHDFPSRKLLVIGVTGTNGKTTTVTLIHGILRIATLDRTRQDGYAGMISTVAADLGDSTADTGLHVTTPTAPQIQALLAQMVDNGLTHCVLEMTSHGLSQGRLNGVDIDVAVMTNVTHEHLDYHGSFEGLSRCQRPYVRDVEYVVSQARISSRSRSSTPMTRMPSISPLSRQIRSFAMVFTTTQIFLHSIFRYEPHATHFRAEANIKGQREYIWDEITHLVGEFNLYNALAAVATTYDLFVKHYPEDDYVATVAGDYTFQGLFRASAIPGRMERIGRGAELYGYCRFRPHAGRAEESTDCRTRNAGAGQEADRRVRQCWAA